MSVTVYVLLVAIMLCSRGRMHVTYFSRPADRWEGAMGADGSGAGGVEFDLIKKRKIRGAVRSGPAKQEGRLRCMWHRCREGVIMR